MENIQAKMNKKLENKISSINIKDKTDDNKKVIKEYLNIESTEKKKKKKKKKEKKVQEDKIITQYDISKILRGLTCGCTTHHGSGLLSGSIGYWMCSFWAGICSLLCSWPSSLRF